MLLAAAAPAMADEVLIWNGFGAGRTAANAINRAIDDVESMAPAGSDGISRCELVEEPLVWTQFYEGFPDPFYFASVNMICE
jgi:hypothetical protein